MRLCALFLMLGAALGARADDVDFERDVKPLLLQKCAACHGALDHQAGLRLDVGRLVLSGSENGAVIVPGDASESLLIRRVTADADERMPPDGEGEPLAPEQIRVLTRWIAAGAPVPDTEVIPQIPREHWAYQPLQRPAIPPVQGDAKLANPVDAFIERECSSRGITPVATAEPGTLLRRVALDLVGLPPTPRALEAFLIDGSVDAYERVVDELLESPQYGERWGRHWMDVWRYSDWDGYKDDLRGSQRHIWRWRDWIIESLNADKGYDRMVMEMIAGDEIAPGDLDVVRATGFLARNYHHSNRDIWLDATVEHTAKAFLGLTINCARCHDHKFDPIPQRDYYAFRAIFEPHKVRTERLPGQPDVVQGGLPRVFDAEPEAPTFVYRSGNEKQPIKDDPVEPRVPEILGHLPPIQPVDLPVIAWFPALEETIEQEERVAAEQKIQAARAELAKLETPVSTGSGQDAEQPHSAADSSTADAVQIRLAQAKLAAADANLQSLQARQAADEASSQPDAANGDELARAAAHAERTYKLRVAELKVLEKEAALQSAQSGGETDESKPQTAIDNAEKELAAAKAERETAQSELDSGAATYTPVGDVYPRTSTGRRSALARWITSRDNPLAARVAVNHIWLRHFGEPLVENVFDFGLRSPRPVHAELLDWLACELMDNHWSMKHLHRLIVTSQTYRLGSSGEPRVMAANAAIDPDNRMFWRARVRRLDAEVIRDSLLFLSGRLDLTQGGPELDFEKAEAVLRRSLYFRHAYEKQVPMLVLFDTASPNECYRRSESIVPQQALALANGTLTLGAARTLAAALTREAQESSPFVHVAFERVLGRRPTTDEAAACLSFLAAQTARLEDAASLTAFDSEVAPTVKSAADAGLRARENLVHVLMNHNDMVTVR